MVGIRVNCPRELSGKLLLKRQKMAMANKDDREVNTCYFRICL